MHSCNSWGIFRTNSAACKKNSAFLFEEIYKNTFADKSQIRYLKYILGVNKHSSNLAVLSETGRFPMYFSVVMSIVKYLYRLENISDELLKEAYVLAKDLYYIGIQTW